MGSETPGGSSCWHGASDKFSGFMTGQTDYLVLRLHLGMGARV